MAEKREKEFAEDLPFSEENGGSGGNPFDLLMFGPGKAKRLPEAEAPFSWDINQINLEEAMGHIDTIVDSAQRLKPVFSKIRPLFKQFLKK